MSDKFESLAAEMKTLDQGGERLPVAEDGWDTRPDAESWGVIALEFEADPLNGDNLKADTQYEGSMDLFSRRRDGGGWIPLVTGMLTKHCEGCWTLNHRAYERETGLFHWEWVFRMEA